VGFKGKSPITQNASVGAAVLTDMFKQENPIPDLEQNDIFSTPAEQASAYHGKEGRQAFPSCIYH
jgi:hypothetical protein